MDQITPTAKRSTIVAYGEQCVVALLQRNRSEPVRAHLAGSPSHVCLRSSTSARLLELGPWKTRNIDMDQPSSRSHRAGDPAGQLTTRRRQRGWSSGPAGKASPVRGPNCQAGSCSTPSVATGADGQPSLV